MPNACCTEEDETKVRNAVAPVCHKCKLSSNQKIIISAEESYLFVIFLICPNSVILATLTLYIYLEFEAKCLYCTATLHILGFPAGVRKPRVEELLSILEKAPGWTRYTYALTPVALGVQAIRLLTDTQTPVMSPVVAFATSLP